MKLSEPMKKALLWIGPRRSPVGENTLRALRRRDLVTMITTRRWILTPKGVDIFLELEKQEEKGEKR